MLWSLGARASAEPRQRPEVVLRAARRPSGSGKRLADRNRAPEDESPMRNDRRGTQPERCLGRSLPFGVPSCNTKVPRAKPRVLVGLQFKRPGGWPGRSCARHTTNRRDVGRSLLGQAARQGVRGRRRLPASGRPAGGGPCGPSRILRRCCRRDQARTRSRCADSGRVRRLRPPRGCEVRPRHRRSSAGSGCR